MTFRRDMPESTKRIRLWVTTQDGTQFQGNLRHFTPDIAQDNRELAIGGSTLQRLPPNADPDNGWQQLTDLMSCSSRARTSGTSPCPTSDPMTCQSAD
jgi:hypothetical protein